MSKDRVYLTGQQIDRALYRLSSLKQSERDEVRKVLRGLQGGGISRYELHRALLKLRSKYTISQLDLDAIERTIFEE